MVEEIILTDVDKLVEILQKEKKMDLRLLAKKLNSSEDTVQKWVDFLVEEKILSVDYDFTKPIVSIIEKKQEKKEDFKEDFLKYKQEYNKKTKKEKQSEFSWKKHILDQLELMKHFFYSEAEKRKLKNINQLWEEYKKKVSEI